jgi:hypothetical protein
VSSISVSLVTYRISCARMVLRQHLEGRPLNSGRGTETLSRNYSSDDDTATHCAVPILELQLRQ